MLIQGLGWNGVVSLVFFVPVTVRMSSKLPVAHRHDF